MLASLRTEKVKRHIAKTTGENPDKQIAQGERLLAEAHEHRADRKKRADNDVKAMCKDAAKHMIRQHYGTVYVPFAGIGERKPLICDVCKQQVSRMIISKPGEQICKKCRSKQQGYKSTVLVMPKFIKVRKAS